MASKNNQSDGIFVSLDAGSSKVLCVVAQPGKEPGKYRILGMGSTASAGIKNGTVVNVQNAVSSIRNAVREAQYTSGIANISQVWAAIGGKTLTSRPCVGVSVLRGREVTQEDIAQAESNAGQHADRESPGGELLKLIPQGFVCGDSSGIANPIGLTAQRLEARMHAVYGSASNAENLKRCMQRAGLELISYEPHPWAASLSVLSETEKLCGAAVIDFGAETISLTVFIDGVLQLIDVRPWGSSLITKDLAIVLGLEIEAAEHLKLTSGSCDIKKVVDDEMVDVDEVTVPGVKPRMRPRKLVVKTVLSRMKEILQIYKHFLIDSGAMSSIRIVVLTGGGSQLAGLRELAESIFGCRVRIGRPANIEGEAPLLQRPDATVALGLVKCADDARFLGIDPKKSPRRRESTILNRIKTIFLGDY